MSNRIQEEFIQKKEPVRLNKYLSEAGVCSRREADRLIESGKVTVDGQPARTGMRILPGQVVKVGKKIVSKQDDMVVLAVNKPKGIVCTEEKRERNSIVRFLNYPVRVTYVGRLDKDSRGLLLMTNNGDIINRMMRAANRHEKEYKVTVDHEITPEFLSRMAAGVPILDTVTRPCTVKQVGKYTFSIILTQGLNRQIRRMCQALGYEVKDLVRVRVMNIYLDGLKEGDRLNIVRRGYLTPGKNRLDLIYRDSSVLGSAVVLRTDDLISECRVEKRFFYDFINEQDHVILIEQNAPSPQYDEQTAHDIYKEILKFD